MIIKKKPSYTPPPAPLSPLSKPPLGSQMVDAFQKFIERAPDGEDLIKPAAADQGSVKLSLRISQDELAGLDQAAKRQGLTRSAFIKRAVVLQRDAVPETPRRAPAAGDTSVDAGQRLRRQLLATLTAHVTRLKLSQVEAARLCGVTQPRISELMGDRGDAIGLETLVNMATSAGLQVDLRVLMEA